VGADMNLYEQIEKTGSQSRGKVSLLKHWDGEKLTRKEAMEAMCYSCMGYFIDGRTDCRLKHCPLYDYRPYKDTTNKAHKSVLKSVDIASGTFKAPKIKKAIVGKGKNI
jgi:hypothetical protein